MRGEGRPHHASGRSSPAPNVTAGTSCVRLASSAHVPRTGAGSTCSVKPSQPGVAQHARRQPAASPAAASTPRTRPSSEWYGSHLKPPPSGAQPGGDDAAPEELDKAVPVELLKLVTVAIEEAVPDALLEPEPDALDEWVAVR